MVNSDNFTLPVYYDITNNKYFIVKNSIRYDIILNTSSVTNTLVAIPGLTTSARINIVTSQTDTTIYNTTETQLYNNIHISPAQPPVVNPPPNQPPPNQPPPNQPPPNQPPPNQPAPNQPPPNQPPPNQPPNQPPPNQPPPNQPPPNQPPPNQPPPNQPPVIPPPSNILYENIFTELTTSVIILNNILNLNMIKSILPDISLYTTDYIILKEREEPIPI